MWSRINNVEVSLSVWRQFRTIEFIQDYFEYKIQLKTSYNAENLFMRHEHTQPDNCVLVIPFGPACFPWPILQRALRLNLLARTCVNPSSTNCVVPSVGSFQETRSLLYCSIVGLNLVSIKVKSSTLPRRKILTPGKAAPTRYMSEPQVEQK